MSNSVRRINYIESTKTIELMNSVNSRNDIYPQYVWIVQKIWSSYPFDKFWITYWYRLMISSQLPILIRKSRVSIVHKLVLFLLSFSYSSFFAISNSLLYLKTELVFSMYKLSPFFFLSSIFLLLYSFLLSNDIFYNLVAHINKRYGLFYFSLVTVFSGLYILFNKNWII